MNVQAWLEIKPRITVICAIVAAVADGLALASVPAAIVCCVALSIAALFILLHKWRLSALLLGIFCFFHFYAASECSRRTLCGGHTFQCLFRARVDDVAGVPKNKLRLTLTVLDGERKGLRLLLRARTLVVVFVGDIIQLRGTVRPARPAVFPWDFDEQRYLARRGLDALVYASGKNAIAVVERAGRSARDDCDDFISSVRGRMVRLHESVLGINNGDLLASMVIGDRAVTPSEAVRQQFRMLGLSHIVAASGFNLSVVALVAWWSIRFLVRQPLFVGIWCLLATVVYSAIAGFSASVERAALMCAVVLLVGGFRRSVHLPASIAAALVISLIVEPRSLLDAGLQLSYAATLAIAMAVTRLNRLIGARCSVPEWLAEGTIVVVVANFAVLPLQMIYYWQVGWLSVPANILVAPMVPAITVLGFVASIIGSVQHAACWSLAAVIDWFAQWPLGLMLLVVDWLSAFKWSLVNVGPPCVWAILFYYAALLGCLSCVALWAQLSAASAAKARSIACGWGFVLLLGCVLLFWRPALNGPAVVMTHDSVLLALPNGCGIVYGNPIDVSVQRAAIYLRQKNLTYVPIAIHSSQPPMFSSSVFQIRDGELIRISNVEQLFTCK